jgi:hypothetical protein
MWNKRGAGGLRALEQRNPARSQGRRPPRLKGPRCGDPPLRLCALWRQCPNEIEAMRRLQPNRCAGGRPSDARRANALDSARGAQGPRDAPPITLRMISSPSPKTGQKDKPRSAGPRGGDLTVGLCHFMAAKSARNSGYAPMAAKSPGRGGGPAMRGGPKAALIPRKRKNRLHPIAQSGFAPRLTPQPSPPATAILPLRPPARSGARPWPLSPCEISPARG